MSSRPQIGGVGTLGIGKLLRDFNGSQLKSQKHGAVRQESKYGIIESYISQSKDLRASFNFQNTSPDSSRSKKLQLVGGLQRYKKRGNPGKAAPVKALPVGDGLVGSARVDGQLGEQISAQRQMSEAGHLKSTLRSSMLS